MRSSDTTIQDWDELSVRQQNLISDRIAQMLNCLQEDIQNIERILGYLDEIRTSVLKRDENALSYLLQKIQTETDEYKNQESRRNFIRSELANLLDRDVQQITLSELEQILPESIQAQVKEKKNKIKLLTNKLQKEHLNTVLLLSECARFNRMILSGIFDFGKQDVVTYSASGIRPRQAGRNLVNFKV
ncbi:MAG: hypothetical protein ACYTFM_00100 [Planctomycetota bacterium]|jgi:hypothetical protein